MGKYIKFLIIFLSLFLSAAFFPEPAFAKEDLYIPEWTVHASLKENGDLEISEDITFEFSEKFNGVYRDITLDEAYSLSDISVKEARGDSFVSYERAEKAKKGDYGVYTIEKKKDRTTIRIYSPSKDEIKIFKINYVVNSAATKYNDTGELYYKFLGKENKTSIGNFTVFIDLPYNDDSDRVKVFAHGPSNGRIDKIVNNQYPMLYRLQAANVKPGSFIEARLLFPPEYIAQSERVIDIDRYQEIINEEMTLQIKKEQQKIRKEFVRHLLNQISFITGIANILAFIAMLYLCRRKADRKILTGEYREIPEDCTPAVASYITGINPDSNIFFATILDLFSKGYLIISPEDENTDVSLNTNFIICKTREADKSLLSHERYFMDWLFDDMGNGKSVSLKDIEYYSRQNPQKFFKSLGDWRSEIKKEAEKRGYLDHSKKIHASVLIILSIFSIILGLVTAISKNISAVLNFSVGFVLLIYGLYLLNRLSDEGYIQHKKWKSFAGYMKKHNPEPAAEDVMGSSDKSLIYALAFGIIKKQILSIEPGLYTEGGWIYWYILFADQPGNSFSDSINKPFTESSFSSDGSFTAGGGDGIGGGGAGGF